ncbi:hypothetical protein BC834DRAFT_889333 [Gloeopeniophorella convolvens]|nr:hypothetical protein BC834DRAFT_889333 [Gloeopeniophorella convolvens]
MGNSSSSSGRIHHEDIVDFGYLTPQGVYSGTRDWKEDVVAQLIVDRKLAPFYRPLEDYDASWDDEQVLAARRDLTPAEHESTSPRSDAPSPPPKPIHHKRPSVATKESTRITEAAIYRSAAECPICFLYYPPNINRSRCCDQAICSECFVQIKRAEPTTTHMVSEPACCPFCVQENFGVVYTPPPWRAGIGSEGWTAPTWPESLKDPSRPLDGANSRVGKQKRSKSFDFNDPDVVTVDQIHPDWEAKLAAVQAAAARRANRRIIMRQVGDRLIPVGITSGRIHPLPMDGAGSEGDGAGSRRSRRRQQQQQDFNNFLGNMGLGGRDLEELMMMEAMRLSLLEHEAHQRREAEQRARDEGKDNSSSHFNTEDRGSPPGANTSDAPSAAATHLPPSTASSASLSQQPQSSSTTPNLTSTLLPVLRQPQANPNHRSGPDSIPGRSNSPPAIVRHHPGLNRMNSLASSVETHETSTGLEGYRFLPSESEESVVAQEPLLHVEEGDP